MVDVWRGASDSEVEDLDTCPKHSEWNHEREKGEWKEQWVGMLI